MSKLVHRYGSKFQVMPVAPGNPGFWDSDKWELDTYISISRFLSPEKTFVDLGAWIGPFTLFAAPFSKEVIAVEPDPVAYSILQSNILLNGYKNIQTIPLAIVGYNPCLFMNTDIPGNSKSMFTKEMIPGAWEVGIVTLSELLTTLRIAKPSIIKIDVEGAEVDILDQSLSWLSTYRPTLHLSTHRLHYPNPELAMKTLWDVISGYSHIYKSSDHVRRRSVTYDEFLYMNGVDAFVVTNE
jgi:FkbM family methyltransferase